MTLEEAKKEFEEIGNKILEETKIPEKEDPRENLNNSGMHLQSFTSKFSSACYEHLNVIMEHHAPLLDEGEVEKYRRDLIDIIHSLINSFRDKIL